MKSSVIATVVENGLCIGCGLCAALCPTGSLTMQWNLNGEYNPKETKPCTIACGLCLRICPFADTGEDEDSIGKGLYGGVPGIDHRPETGYYLAVYRGYSERYRPASSSGGVATWILDSLLAAGVVDHIVCVVPTGDPERLFAFQVFETREDVRSGAGSAYYPVELSAVVRHILETPGRYAVTGLPCFIKAIRLAQQRNATLRERVVVCVGLTCGQLKSRHFTDYIASLAGVTGKVTGVCYRGKSPDQPASNYHYRFTTADRNERKIFWNDGIAEAWTNLWFTPKACCYCDDIFAECADVTCMDAWLPEYSRDYRGTNLVIIRSPLLQDLISRGIMDGELQADPAHIQDVIRSQAGVIEFKRRSLTYRLHLGLKRGEKVPGKRVGPERPPRFIQREVVMKDHVRASVQSLWIKNPSAEHLREKMWLSMKLLAFRSRMIRIITLPMRGTRHIYRTKIPGILKKNSINDSYIQSPSHATILQNARESLNIPTYDGSNQMVHPSVIDFLAEHGLPQWGGFRFWMVITPYPYGNDASENPSIYTSNDGINWFVPPRINNPIDYAPGGWDQGFNNDPDMVYDPDQDEIRVYFRFASTDHLNVKLVRISNDHGVSEPITVISQSPWTQSDNTHRSLCIWRESSRRWHMWGGGGTKTPPYNLFYRFSEDGIHWESPIICLNDEGNDPFQALGYSSWHISCKPNYCEDRIEFLSYATPVSSEGKGVLLYAECSMGSPTLFRTPIVQPILRPSEYGWDNGTLYRCSFCITNTGGCYYYRIWYSAESHNNIWKLGYTGGYIGTEYNNDQKSPVHEKNGEPTSCHGRFRDSIQDLHCSFHSRDTGGDF